MAYFKGKTLISAPGIVLQVAGETRELMNSYKGVSQACNCLGLHSAQNSSQQTEGINSAVTAVLRASLDPVETVKLDRKTCPDPRG